MLRSCLAVQLSRASVQTVSSVVSEEPKSGSRSLSPSGELNHAFHAVVSHLCTVAVECSS